jgi:hypothetical protein
MRQLQVVTSLIGFEDEPMLQKVPMVSAVFVPANLSEPITRMKANLLEHPRCLLGSLDADELPVLLEDKVYTMISDPLGIIRGLAPNKRASAMVRDYVARHDPAGSEWFVYGNGLLIEPRDSIVAPMSSRADVFMDARRR